MKPITVNYPERRITLSSAFERRAFTPGTPEYAQLMEVRHEFPDFRLDTRQFKTNTKQDRYKGLTYLDALITASIPHPYMSLLLFPVL